MFVQIIKFIKKDLQGNNMNKNIYYKYRSAKEGLDILENLNIWFCNPQKFEDKKDCRPNFKFTNPQINDSSIAKKVLLKYEYRYGKDLTNQGLERLKEFLPTELLSYVLKKHLIKDVRVLSLSKTNNNQKMWKDYTNKYAGIVIGLNFKNQIFENFINADINYYDSNKYCLEFNGTFEDYYGVTDKGNSDICNLFLHKDNKYSFENEYRFNGLIQKLKIQLKNKKYFPKNNYKNLSNNNGFTYHIDKSEIVEIYLGSKINNSDKLHILSIVKTKLPHVKIYQMIQKGKSMEFSCIYNPRSK